MEVRVGSTVLSVVRGDITVEDVDAIVNAANESLAGGGGVDGAIHRAGGPQIMEECRAVGACPTGGAVMTTGGNLKARRVIHAVGPVYRGGARGEARLLALAYESSLALALHNGLGAIAFPSISTGAYGYPLKEAARIAVKAVVDFVRAHPGLRIVRFVLFSDEAQRAYEEALEAQ